MKVYAVIDRFEESYVVLEVETIEVQYSFPEDFDTKETEMINVERDYIETRVGHVEESDVLVVEYSDDIGITDIICNDVEEKQRRIDVIMAM